MNDQPLLFAALAPPLEERAERIRSLVTVARGCIIEIGRELIQAREELRHGEWLPWLSREFGWSEWTARNYMAVAESFGKSGIIHDFSKLQIDGTALYALAAPEVPEGARQEAIERAEAGEHITKDKAQKMVEDAVSSAVRAAIEKERESADARLVSKTDEIDDLRERLISAKDDAKHGTEEAVREARDVLVKLQSAYDEAVEERNALQKDRDNPSEDQIINLVSKLSRKRPARLMLVSIASALGRKITFGGTEYLPAAEPDIERMRREDAEAKEKLGSLSDPNGSAAKWHRALGALRLINSLGPIDDLFNSRHAGIDHALAEELPKAERWIVDFHRMFTDVNV